MAKPRKAGRKPAGRKAKSRRKAARSAKRPSIRRRASKPKTRAKARKPAKARKTAAKAKPAKRTASKPRAKTDAPIRSTPARLARDRRILADVIPTPPSSLDMDRHGSAVRTGRAEMAQSHANHASMTPDISAGDVDVNVEDAYFVGDESPGGDNPTPDQEVVDEIGKALGVEYQDAEELRGSDKVADRDKHRWELDPASSEDYKNRK